MSKLRLYEAGLYVRDLERAEAFYRSVLGLEVAWKVPGYAVALWAGEAQVILFDPEATREATEVPPHGAEGPGHVALATPLAELEGWRRHLEERGVEIAGEATFGQDQVFYFRDPDGNLLEIYGQAPPEQLS